ncbi:MAG: hypothetical protein D6791_18910 [Chloroflexi bacterium]|nr:MAG: hypothetical protein D6791_18910 [Chloroflexota bacterium]
MKRNIWLAWTVYMVVMIAFSGCQADGHAPRRVSTPEPPADRETLARSYAPVIHQGAASDQDFITAVNFDNDWIGNNNWQNQPTGDLAARVYYAVFETDTHWYLFYSLFHPRDYTPEPCAESDGCHENDMESLQVVVAKDGSALGHLQALLTLAHNHIYLYAGEDRVRRGALKVAGQVRREGTHPQVWVEAYGHGIYGRPRGQKPGSITYRPGTGAEVPASLEDEDVRYELVSIYDTLWPRRQEMGPGKLFDQPFVYRHQLLPAAFDGDDWGEDKANTPWGYAQEIGRRLERGDFFLDPARAFVYFASVPGRVSQTYRYNPFLEDLK